MKRLLLVILLPLFACDKPADITPAEYQLEFLAQCSYDGARAVEVTFQSEYEASMQIEYVLPNIPIDTVYYLTGTNQLGKLSPLCEQKTEDGYFSACLYIPAGTYLTIRAILSKKDLPNNGGSLYFGDWYSRVNYERTYKLRQLYGNCKD